MTWFVFKTRKSYKDSDQLFLLSTKDQTRGKEYIKTLDIFYFVKKGKNLLQTKIVNGLLVSYRVCSRGIFLKALWIITRPSYFQFGIYLNQVAAPDEC